MAINAWKSICFSPVLGGTSLFYILTPAKTRPTSFMPTFCERWCGSSGLVHEALRLCGLGACPLFGAQGSSPNHKRSKIPLESCRHALYSPMRGWPKVRIAVRRCAPFCRLDHSFTQEVLFDAPCASRTVMR